MSIEKEPQNIEALKNSFFEVFDRLMVDVDPQLSGRLFLGSGVQEQARSRYFTYGPSFQEKIQTKYVLGRIISQNKSLTVVQEDGVGGEGRDFALMTIFTVHHDYGELAIAQIKGTSSLHYDLDDFPLHGIKDMSLQQQWGSLLELTKTQLK